MSDTIDTFPATHTQPADGLTKFAMPQPMSKCVETALHNYFVELGDSMPTRLYEMVLEQLEAPLLKLVLQKTNGNQTKAAALLGLSRGTLRKKLKQYDLD